MLAEFRGVIEISLAERRTAAAFAVCHQFDFKAQRFEDFDRGDADVRLVITNKCVVPQE